jgi:hypothetical protein
MQGHCKLQIYRALQMSSVTAVTQARLILTWVLPAANTALPAARKQVRSIKKKVQLQLYGRLDYQLNSKNLLTLSNNYIYDLNNQNIGDNTAISLYEVYGTSRNKSNSLLATLYVQL